MNAKTYRVNEIFLSLQGEGHWTGTPMVFLRLSGCNLHCPPCDTAHANGVSMDCPQILEAIRKTLSHSHAGERRLCLTGGEPSLQVDKALVDALHKEGFLLHMETNGTLALPPGIDWVTCSPKDDFPGVGNARVALERADELKLLFRQGMDPSRWEAFPATWRFLQPCDEGPGATEATQRNVAAAIDYILRHPLWRLSLQTHKLLHIR